jgi:hypothetical protein
VSNQAVDIRVQVNKDVELPLKVGDRVLSNGDLCELTQIGDATLTSGQHVLSCFVLEKQHKGTGNVRQY